jgi:hypothetical protein
LEFRDEIEEFGRVDVGDGLVPQRRRHMVLQRCDPLRRVFGRPIRFDYALVIGTCCTGERQSVPLSLGFL